MGIRIQFDEIIDYVLRQTGITGRIYLLGTQDCNFTYRDYANRHPGFRDDFGGVSPAQVMDVKDYFYSKGFKEVVTIDMNESADLKLDLNIPVPENLYNTADCIMDFGTLEHVFNVPEAMTGLYNMLVPTGVILHAAPVSFFHHGYYNFNPSFFDEFYTVNGYETVLKTYQVRRLNPLFGFMPRFSYFYCFNLPFKKLSKKINLIRLFRIFTFRIFMPGFTLYVCAFRKQGKTSKVRLPYDVWD